MTSLPPSSGWEWFNIPPIFLHQQGGSTFAWRAIARKGGWRDTKIFYFIFLAWGSLKHRDIIMPHRVLLKLEAYQVWARHSLTWAWWHAHRGIRALELGTQLNTKKRVSTESTIYSFYASLIFLGTLTVNAYEIFWFKFFLTFKHVINEYDYFIGFSGLWVIRWCMKV